MTKKILIGVVAVVALILFSGIGDTGSPPTTAVFDALEESPVTTTVAPTTTVTTTTLPRGVMGSIFVSSMRNESMTYTDITWIDSMPDEAIVEWGMLVCDFLSDSTAREVVQSAEIALEALYEQESIFEADYQLIYYGLGASIGAFCPEYEYKLSDL